MSESEKSIRLSKVAKEFNLSISTIADFLAGKGHKIDNNPNAKINDMEYSLLQKTFQSEKSAKEESQQISISKQKKESSFVLEADETVHHNTKKEIEQPEILIKNLQTPTFVEKEVKKAEEIPALTPVVETPAPVVAETPVAKPKAKTIMTDAPADENNVVLASVDIEKLSGPNIVGKIDLSTINSKTKPDKKKKGEGKVAAKDVVAETPKTPQAVAPKVIETPVVDVKTEASVADASNNIIVEAPKEETLYRRDIEKLTGPNIIGKIELPVARKLVASSSSFNDDKFKKKKRKRTADKKEGSTPSTTPGGAPNTGAPRPLGTGSYQPQGAGYQGKKPDFKRTDGNKRPVQPATPKAEPTEKEIQEQIKATLARLSGSGKSKGAKHRKSRREQASQQAEEDKAERELQKSTIKVTEFVSANELAKLMDVSVTEIISTCMSLGMFVSINQRLDAETLTIVAEEFGYKVEFVTVDVQEAIEEQADSPEDLLPRAPIVTVMGHVDHGKTSLLDYVRKANVIAGEAGGITQHIGAYEVTLDNGKKITFLDTPGHEAFTAMRARGAKVTDIAIIVIAADDSVMPQTIEAINHAQAANVPIIIAINKIDKPGANPEKIKERLAGMNILVEDWGGKYQCQEISAKKGLNIDALLEKVLLEAELLDLQANPNKNAVGTIVESSLDKGKGYVTTVLVQAGTLKIGDVVLAGCFSGKVKAMFNERNGKINTAGPSTPALLLGMTGAPQAGDTFNVMNDEREARDIANKRMQLQREQGVRTQKHITLDEIGRRLAIGNFKELNVIIKGDVDGSIEALTDSLLKLSTEQIQVNVLHKSVGQITESDVLLASASNAIIIGFQVRPSVNARKLAEAEQIDIRLYSIIYDAINELKAAMEGMLDPEFEEKIVCNIEIRETFKIPKVGTIAGCYVLSGKINRNTSIRIVRDGIVIHTGSLASLKRFKDDVKEVATGYECGLNIAGFNNIEVGDIVEGYEQVAVKRTLA
jgi:translation initiation factor IF-2